MAPIERGAHVISRAMLNGKLISPSLSATRVAVFASTRIVFSFSLTLFLLNYLPLHLMWNVRAKYAKN